MIINEDNKYSKYRTYELIFTFSSPIYSIRRCSLPKLVSLVGRIGDTTTSLHVLNKYFNYIVVLLS